MSINSRTKGSRNERQLSKLLEKWTGKKFARTPSSGGLQWKTSMAKGDIVSTTEGFYFPFCIEAKFHKKIDFSHLLMDNIKNCDILDFWAQCKRDALLAKKIPMLFMRFNGLKHGFHFVMVEKPFWQFCLNPFHSNQVSKRSLSLKIKDLEAVIIPCEWLFSLSYKRLNRIFKNYNLNQAEIIKDWPKVKGWRISNRGYLIDPEGNKLYGAPDGTGANQVFVEVKGKCKRFRIYREVALVFVKNPKQKPQVNHILPNRNISDARNLEWVKASENRYHRWENKGELGYKIAQVCPKTNEILNTYLTCYQAARSLGEKNGKHISRVLRKEKTGRITAHGFKWIKIIT